MKSVYYFYNEERRMKLNSAGLDYTPAYIPALLFRLGISGRPCEPKDVGKLGADDILIVGAEPISMLPGNVGAVILLGSAVGSELEPTVKNATIYGYLDSRSETQIPLFTPIHPAGDFSEVIAWVSTKNERCPALVQKTATVWQFLFDLPATIWYSGDGFEKNEPQNGFFIGRTPDTRPLPIEMNASEPYNDLLISYLERILVELDVPMVYHLPPNEDGSVPDFVLHISGDDDHTSSDINLSAAKVMHGMGLPYHINAMPAEESFIFDKNIQKELEAFGCELALHSDFTAYPYTQEAQKQMAEIFKNHLGRSTKTNVNHCFIQGGTTAERMRWLESCNILADNGKMGEVDLSDINAFDLCGFSFGTSFPRYTCDDAAHANRLIATMEIPINFYEPRLGGSYNKQEQLEKYIDEAAEYGRIIDFFIHPHYLYPDYPDTPYTLSALSFCKEYWEEAGYHPLLTTTDSIAEFWQARRNVKMTVQKNKIEIFAPCKMFLRLPDGHTSVLIDHKIVKVIALKKENTFLWLVPILESGFHVVQIN